MCMITTDSDSRFIDVKCVNLLALGLSRKPYGKYGCDSAVACFSIFKWRMCLFFENEAMFIFF